jgi:parvulin-like peptidyl-prolyl isomerase
LQAGAWYGPIESGYGLHLVYVSKVQPFLTPPLAQIRPQVLQGWREQNQRDADERYFAQLMHKYNVVIDDSVKSLIGPIGVAQASEEPR